MIKRIGALVFILTLFFAVGVTAQAADVPSGYSILEYIQTSGTQYIDTGFVPDQDTRVVTDVYIDSLPSYDCAIFGARETYTKNGFSVWISSGRFFSNYANSYEVTGTAAVGRYSIDKNKNITTINNLVITLPASNSFTTPGSMFIGSCNASDTNPTKFNGKFYSFFIFDNDTLVRDYVPVKNLSGVVGLWDKVTGQFVGNSGTGSFTAGPVVEVVPSQEYEVTVNGSYASNSGSGSYREGVTVTINAGTRDGYTFTGWTSSVPLADSSSATTSFTMPSSAVTVTANWQQDAPPVPTYQVSVNGSYASNSGSGSYAEGVTVLIHAGSRDGYTFAGWIGSVNFADSTSASTSFIMPAEAVSVTANWEELPPPPSPSDFDVWTPVESHVLFSGGDSWTMDLSTSNSTLGGGYYTFYGDSGSYAGTFGVLHFNDLYVRDTGWISFRATLGGMLLEKGQTYRLRIYQHNAIFANMPNLYLGDVTVIASEGGSASSSYDVVFTSNSDHYAYLSTTLSGAAEFVGAISGRLDRVQPTASGDSFSSTASDIENNSNQLTQIENDILSDLEIYSAQVNPLDINFGSGIVNAMSFISSIWSNAFGQLGELQSVVTFPLFLGLALLFIGRASSVIVSGSMKSQRNNDKKGGGDIG